MSSDHDQLISIPVAAKAIGLERSTLGKLVRAGKVRSHGRKVRLSEVLEDRAAAIDLTRSKRSQGEVDGFNDDDASDAAVETAEPVIVDGQALPYKEARALKETYLARLRKLEYDRESCKVVEIDAVGEIVSREYNVVRNRALTVPGKLADRLAMRPRDVIFAALQDEMHEMLGELSDPDDVPQKALR